MIFLFSPIFDVHHSILIETNLSFEIISCEQRLFYIYSGRYHIKNTKVLQIQYALRIRMP